MRVLVIGGTRFLGRAVVEALVDRGDDVMAVHRGRSNPPDWDEVARLLTDRRDLPRHADAIADFAPDVVLDAIALTGDDVDTAVAALPDVPAVALSSQDVYQAHAALLAGRSDSPVPLTEGAELRRERYPYRGQGLPEVPDDYSKLDVEDRWLARGAVVLRLPLVYGPHDFQRREEPVLRRLRAGREIPVGAANLLWTRGYVHDLASAVVLALDRAPELRGEVFNLGEDRVVPVGAWFEQIIAAAGGEASLVRVPESAVPPELALTGAPSQHLLVSVERARDVLGWTAGDPAARVAESVRWHLEHPPEEETWTADDAAADDAALAARLG